MNASTDNVELGWRMGAPRISEDPEAWSAERVRERFCSFRESAPTAQVWRGDGPVSALPYALRSEIDALRFMPIDGTQPMTWRESLAANHTDGIVVLHKGRIVYEHYDGPLRAPLPHVCMSVTKSLVGTLTAAEMVAGHIDPDAPVTDYVPELAGSAWATATVRQTMDMTTALHYDEDYTRPDAEVWSYLRAAGPHGEAFAYKTVNTEVLSWILCKVTGRTLQQLMAERLWAPMGAEFDAYFALDGQRLAGAGGAFSGALRDMARFGEVMRCNGFFNGTQIVPEAAIADIRQGASPAHFAHAGYKLLPGWSYRHMWWVTHNGHGAYCARGIHGQGIYVDPVAGMTIARFASHPGAGNANLDPTTLPAYHALAIHLMGIA